MADDKSSNTKELIAEGEALRSSKKARLSDTKNMVREAEELIGRRPKSTFLGRNMVIVLMVVAALGALWFFWSRT